MVGSSIVSAVSGLVSEWFQNKREKGRAKHEVELKQISNEATWEQQQAKNAMSSWKDEWLTSLFSIPLIGAFFPPAVPHIREGFRVLSEMPEWYLAYVGIMVAASFGLKAATKITHKK